MQAAPQAFSGCATKGTSIQSARLSAAPSSGARNTTQRNRRMFDDSIPRDKGTSVQLSSFQSERGGTMRAILRHGRWVAAAFLGLAAGWQGAAQETARP